MFELVSFFVNKEEKNIHSPYFRNLIVFPKQPQNLLVTILVRLDLRFQGSCVIPTKLDVSGASRPSAIAWRIRRQVDRLKSKIPGDRTVSSWVWINDRRWQRNIIFFKKCKWCNVLIQTCIHACKPVREIVKNSQKLFQIKEFSVIHPYLVIIRTNHSRSNVKRITCPRWNSSEWG